MTKVYASRNIGVAEIQIVIGDITKQTDMDAIVNSANSKLLSGSGVSAVIFRAAGAKELANACKGIAIINVGDAVITPGFLLPNRYIIHCCGPQYSKDSDAKEKLASCYWKILTLAEENQISSLAIPAISTGAHGFPIEEATKICINEIKASSPVLDRLKTIRFVVRDEAIAKIYARYLMEVIPLPDKAVQVAFDAQFSTEQFQRIRKGYISGNQDCKWFMYFDDPWFYIFYGNREFGHCWWFLKFEQADDGYSVAEAWTDGETQHKEHGEHLYWLLDDYLLGGAEYQTLMDGDGISASFRILRSGRIDLEISSSRSVSASGTRELGVRLVALADALARKSDRQVVS